MSKKFFKTMTMGILIFVMVFCLAACGNKDDKKVEENSNGGDSDSNEQVTIQFATYGLLEKATEKFYTKVAKDFEEKTNVKIEFVSYPYGDLKQQVLIKANSGDAPDVVHGESSAFSSYLNSGFIEPLDDLLGEDYVNDIYEGVRETMSSDGKLYAAPWICSTFLLVYNKDLFEQAGLDPNSPPKTYDEMIEYAEKLSELKDKEGNKVFGLGSSTASVPVSGENVLSTMLSFGGNVYNDKGEVEINTNENLKALKFYKELQEQGLNPEAAKLKDLRNLMAIGRLGMYFDQVWGTSGVIGINPEIKDSLALGMIPSTDATDGASLLAAHELHIMKDSKHKKEAAEFIKYLTSKEVLEEYYNTTLPFIVARKSVNEGLNLNDDFVEPVRDSMSQVIALYKQHPDMENALLEITSAAQRVTIGNETPEEVIKKLDDKLKQVLK
ncbi:ABC transporter substrate-binding protein [Vallitalea longa]|uniref:ABC transporter substrate-binding protein n=1 Tax=Vallitalea longa TaxID=2936439 RepID=A0A9W6DG35_9FIRM|nr:sugar ABC transporter substrate-binding protein [Vallitalea longa]GKX31891.1 ABC transporter substrate-binding protein [Vallitalea longa]